GGNDVDPNPKTLAFVIPGPYPPPDGADKTATLLQNHSYAFADNDFYQQSPLAHTNPPPHGSFGPPILNLNDLLAVKIDSLPALSVLTDNGWPVSVGQSISAADITAGKLKFTPPTNYNGAALAKF